MSNSSAMNSALLLIDMQKYFQNANPRIFYRKIIPNTKVILDFSRRQGIEVIHIITKYKADKSNWPNAFRDRETIWCLEGTEESEIIDGFAPQEGESLTGC